MKKIDTDMLEKMAKEKNIDKEKIEKIADGYKGKSENELIDELVKIGKNLEGKEQVVSKLKAFLNDEQRKKLDSVMNKISDAEIKDKLENKKSKSKKQTPSNDSSTSSNLNKSKKTKPSNNHQNTINKNTSETNTPKKTKKTID
ncbi:hypothetical protein [Romboutsia sp. 13368]|uniref:hypothetical protein n=1 Tax=Romboutsia sp. 13368 TaxID=2708053 RepID=UPI0025CF71F7|nr:hypothetical protein [Romboutsia sp. 13368]